jgi:hypothetical protein
MISPTAAANCLVALDLIESAKAGDTAKVRAYLDIHNRDQLRALALDLIVIGAQLGDDDLDIAELREIFSDTITGSTAPNGR